MIMPVINTECMNLHLAEISTQIVRSLVSAIILTSEGGKLGITLQGDLAAMLSYAA